MTKSPKQICFRFSSVLQKKYNHGALHNSVVLIIATDKIASRVQPAHIGRFSNRHRHQGKGSNRPQTLRSWASGVEVLDDEVLAADGVHDDRRPSDPGPGLEPLLRRLQPLLVGHSPWDGATEDLLLRNDVVTGVRDDTGADEAGDDVLASHWSLPGGGGFLGAPRSRSCCSWWREREGRKIGRAHV